MMTVTFNMAGGLPPKETIHNLFRKDKIVHDIYAFGSQEAERPIAASLIISSKERLYNLIRQYFNIKEKNSLAKGALQQQKLRKSKTAVVPKKINAINDLNQLNDEDDEFVIVEECTLAATSMIVIIRKKFAKLVSNIEKEHIVLGWFNQIANKGAVCIKF